MEKRRKSKICKWDETQGAVEVEIDETVGSLAEDPGAEACRSDDTGGCYRSGAEKEIRSEETSGSCSRAGEGKDGTRMYHLRSAGEGMRCVSIRIISG